MQAVAEPTDAMLKEKKHVWLLCSAMKRVYDNEKV